MAEANTSTTTTTSPSVSISDYPGLPLLTIFDYVPLMDLLHIDEVCRAWQELKPAACSRRRHLIIASDPDDLKKLEPPGIESVHLPPLVGEENISPYLKPILRRDHNALFIGHSRPLQTAATLDRVLELMPNLKVFRLVRQHGSHEELSKVNQLLAHYRHQLVEVSIWFWGGLTNGDRNRTEAQLAFPQMFLSLMASLNRLTALRSLHVNFKPPPNCPVVLDDRQRAAHCLPDVVGRLKWLKFRTRLEVSNSNNNNSFAADARLLEQILFRLRDGDKAVAGEGSKSKQQPPQPKEQENLELYVRETPLTLKTLVSLGPGQVATGLRSVSIDGKFSADSAAEYKALARFARQSPHLQTLNISLKSLRIRRLVESLASLQELINLRIFSYPVLFSLPETANIDQLPVMPSVKFLELHFPATSHRDYKQLHLEVLFPNVQTVLWIHIGVGCLDCDYMIEPEELAHWRGDHPVPPDWRQFKAAYGRPMQRCLRLARVAAFSRLPQLKYLWETVSPFYVKLPFKEEMFTNCPRSLYRQTEFVDQNSVDPHHEGLNSAVYCD